MEHSHAVHILESLAKDSKFFMGLLAGKDCWPIERKKENLAAMLYELGKALLDVDKQLDLFDTEREQPKVLPFVECPECHHQQPDGGHGEECINCGFGPMPTLFEKPSSAVILEQQLFEQIDAIYDNIYDETDVTISKETIESWSEAERGEVSAYFDAVGESKKRGEGYMADYPEVMQIALTAALYAKIASNGTADPEELDENGQHVDATETPKKAKTTRSRKSKAITPTFGLIHNRTVTILNDKFSGGEDNWNRVVSTWSEEQQREVLALYDNENTATPPHMPSFLRKAFNEVPLLTGAPQD